jgi:4-hydroxybenzoate polyprenyltransferase
MVIFFSRNSIAWLGECVAMIAKKLKVYLRLMRFHKPAGIVLLWVPTAWALWIANQGLPSSKIVVYFFLGTVFMRAAGCVMNDIADRHIDKHVQRTQLRPLTTGEIHLPEALGLLFSLLFAAFTILMQLPATCFYAAIVALFLTVLYPFCKRFIQAPQLVLGLVFSMGILMAFYASDVSINSSMICLFMINFMWIIAYDTMYAMVDREDDLRIGVQSTAVLFAQNDRLIILSLQIALHGLWLLLAYLQHFSMGFYICWLGAGGFQVYQQQLIHNRKPMECLKAFSMSSWYGLLMWLALVIG